MLLHEATFDDELRGDAEAKMHCTTSEAIGVGIAMGARRVLLTHFSQRYPKIPVMDGVEGQELKLEEDDGSNDKSPMIALDPDSVRSESQTSLGEMVESDTTLDEILTAETRPRSRCQSRSRSRSRNASPNRPGSPKITRIGSYSPKLQTLDMKVGVAFDYMRVKVKDIALLEKLSPALLKLYDVDDRSEEGKAKGVEGGEKRKGGEFGGGRMGRVKVGEEGRREIKSGKGLFDDEMGIGAGQGAVIAPVGETP